MIFLELACFCSIAILHGKYCKYLVSGLSFYYGSRVCSIKFLIVVDRGA